MNNCAISDVCITQKQTISIDFCLCISRYEDATSPESQLQKSLGIGEDSVSKVYIGYLATRLNKLNDTDRFWQQTISSSNNATYVNENNNSTASYIIERRKSLKQQIIDDGANDAAYIIESNNFNASSSLVEWKLSVERGKKLLEDTRTELLTILKQLPVRDEVGQTL